MNKEYKNDREYSVLEVIRYNLKMWWLAAALAIIFAAALGGYKYLTLHEYVENEVYENKMQVKAALMVNRYNDGSVTERANNVMKIAASSRAYDNFCEITGWDISLEDYQKMFETEQSEASDVVSLYVLFPNENGDFVLMEEEHAVQFMNALIETIDKTTEELMGTECVSILDAPYISEEIEKLKTYSISKEDYRKAILKAVTAGVLLGIIVEVVLYTFWMLIYRKPKSAEEIRECLDTQVIDVLKSGEDHEESFKKVALYLKDDTISCNRISCMNARPPKKDSPLKLAMSYANEQKKTLYVDLATGDGGNASNSISRYVLGETEEVAPLKMNDYLDSFTRNTKEEKGMDLTGNKRFGTLLDKMSEQYDCIIINSADATKSAEAYTVSKVCNKTVVFCGRKTITNENMYRVKNTAEVNGIRIDGVLIYEL